jgi:ribosomal protein L7/L12
VKHRIPPEVLAAWNNGDKVDAIRALRDRTGLGLGEAKAAFESSEYSVLVPTPPSTRALPPSVHSAIASGDKIEAIKLAREATGLGLTEAKKAVEAATAGAPASVHQSIQRVGAGEVPRTRMNWLAMTIFVGFTLVVLLLAALVF